MPPRRSRIRAGRRMAAAQRRFRIPALRGMVAGQGWQVFPRNWRHLPAGEDEPCFSRPLSVEIGASDAAIEERRGGGSGGENGRNFFAAESVHAG